MPSDRGYHDSLFWRGYEALSRSADRRVGWDRLPRPLGLVVLVGLRSELRKRNLHDTTNRPPPHRPARCRPRPADLSVRTINGAFNDLDQPAMGMTARFGRNLPIDRTWREPPDTVLEPSPWEISRALLTRRQLQFATGANALVAAGSSS